MTAYTAEMHADPAAHVKILKAVKADDHEYPTPSHPLGQVGPVGVRFDRVAHLPSLCEPDVAEWVASHSGEGLFVMVAFARGMEVGQVAPEASYEIAVSAEDDAAIRQAARAELAEHLRPLGARVDHLGGPREIRVKSDWVRTHWRDVLEYVRSGGTVIVEHYNRPVAQIGPIEENAMEHFTAWLTTDITCLDQPNADVVVLRDELRGEPDDHDAWSSTGDPLFHAVTAVDAKEGDEDDAQREAEDLLTDAGWKLDGAWEPVTTGFIATVTRA